MNSATLKLNQYSLVCGNRKMSAQFLLLSCLFFLIVSNERVMGLETKVPYHNCGSPLMYLTRLDVIPCEKDLCVFQRGENATLIADFATRINSTKLAIDVYQQDPNFPVLEGIIWSKKDVCGSFNVQCPAVAGEVQQAIFRVTLPKSMPTLKLRLKLVAFGDNDVQMLCYSVPLEVR